jgi:SAM-dependent methyltransferase
VEPAEYRRVFEAEEAQWWYAGMRSISLAVLAGPLRRLDRGRPLTLLDAGCGTGGILKTLGAFGPAVGIDVSEEALRFCRIRGVPAARAELAALPFPDDAFDCVASLDVIYHAWVADDRAAVREMRRVLRPGGLLLLRVPALRLLWGAHDRAVHSRHRYTRSEVRALLEGGGLEVLRLSYCNAFLFPLLAARRTLDRLTGRAGSDVAFLPAPLEWAFRRVLEAEARLLRRGHRLPVGASLIALGRKPD